MERNRLSVEPAAVRLPQSPLPPLQPSSFVLWPLGAFPGATLEQCLWQQWVYLRAFEQAQAVVRPSLLERDLLGVWN